MTNTRSHEYSTLEVDEGAHLPQVRTGTELPEAFDQAGKELEHLAVVEAPKQTTICGLRRRHCWILFTLAIAIILGVAIGVGVGVSRKKDSEENANNSAHSTIATGRGVSPTSSLAAANYTDAEGVEHSQVYYQDNSLQIYMADRSNSTATWSLSELLTDDDTSIHPKNGTPIAAYNWWNENNSGSADFRCTFIDTDSYLRSIWAQNRNAAAGWRTVSRLDGFLSPSANSSLVAYMPPCAQCDPSDFIGFEARGAAHLFVLQYPFGHGQSGAFIPEEVVAPRYGSAMAVAPVLPVAEYNETRARVAFYLVDGAGRLVEMLGSADARFAVTAQMKRQSILVDDGARIAAMTQIRDELLNTQVLVTRTDGGVKMVYWNGRLWDSENSVEGMEDVLPLSPIAATQTGMVYALESGPQVVEWKRVDGSTPMFERVGVVDTTAS